MGHIQIKHVHHSASGSLVKVGAGRTLAKVFGMWHLLEHRPVLTMASMPCTICPSQSQCDSSSPLSIFRSSRSSGSFLLGLCVLCAVCSEPPALQRLYQTGPGREIPAPLAGVSSPNTSSRVSPHLFRALSEGPVEGFLHALTPQHKPEMIIFMHLYAGLLSVLS